MKKLLALVLALVMTLSLAVVGSNAAFTDADKVNETYSEAVNVLSGMKVFQGYTDGSFQPTGDITRAEVAAIVYRLYTGDVSDTQASLYATYNKFSDMDGAKWAAGYIGYCANAGLIKGYDAKTFGPSNNVTGYEALAMILRAVGYDANGEFTGADWQLHVAQYAQQLGVLQNVKGVDLNAAASRELVAELLFRTAAEVPMVTYSAALGYTNLTTLINGTKNDTLGYKNFKLVATEGTTDDFGRPSRTWNYNTGDKKTVVAQVADATYTTKVSECDIAHDLGITTTASLEKAYIDGVAQTLTSADVTSNRYASINPLATTSYVGAQGRVTEVYAMANGTYRIVEVNTYLAVATGVKAATTDANGHTTAATTTFSVYQNKSGTVTKAYTFKSDAFTVGQYALVQIANPNNDAKGVVTTGYMAKASAVDTSAAGTVVRYTAANGAAAATTTVGETVYNDADKFILMGSYTNAKNSVLGKAYNVIVDEYGNLIGLVEGATNYLVVEAISWIHDGTLRGGKAVADVVLADGTRVENVTVSSVGSKPVTNTATSTIQNIGSPADAFVSDYWTNNTNYYNHLTTYSVNADGTYSLGYNTNASSIGFGTDSAAKAATITKGLTTITGAVSGSAVNYVVANDSTVFLVKDAKTGVYTTYVGKNNVPSMKNATICYLTKGGYATVVLVTEYAAADNYFMAYVSDNGYTGYVSDKGYEYAIWKTDGTSTNVYSANNTLIESGKDGLYWVTVNDDGIVASAVSVLGTSSNAVKTENNMRDGMLWDRAFAKSAVAGNVLISSDKDGDQFADYYLDNAKYYLVSDNGYTTVTETTKEAVAGFVFNADDSVKTRGSKIFVGYTMVGAVKHAQAIFVFANSTSDVNEPDLTYTVSGTPVVAGTNAGITVTGLTFNYEDKAATVNPGKGGTISVALYKHNTNGYDTTPYTVLNDTMPGSVITGGTWTLNKTISATLDAGQYYANVTVTMADGTTSTYNTIYFTVAA